MRADRLLRLALVLQARGRTTAAVLAAELEVSVRTIYRDLEALSVAGIPVYTEAGPGGGCQLIEGYRTPLTGLTTDEAAALLILGVPAPLRDLGLEARLQSAHGRVRAASGLPIHDVTVHLDMPRWFHAREHTAHLPAIAANIETRRRLDLQYDGASGGSRHHRVDPIGIVNKAGVWYLVTRIAQRFIVFRIARIRSLTTLDETFDRPSDFDLAAYWDAWSAEFEASRPRAEVALRASPDAIAALPEIFGDAVQTALAAAGDPDRHGWRSLTLTFESEGAAVYRLAGFGGLIEVTSPDSIRARLLETATLTVALYR